MRSRREIYLDILYWGLLNIRGAAYAGDSDQCYVEADHLHNIPGLLRSLDKEKLHEFYWNIMRPDYIQSSKPEYAIRFEQLWKELEEATQEGKQSS